MARTVHLEDTLGEGAFGVVHLARVSDEEGFVQRLAVKMLHAHYSADDDLARRLRDEARLLALLEHDNIVRVHGLSRIDGRLAILMEPIQGADLSCAQGQVMPPRVALQIIEAAASALAAAWETVPPGQDEPLKAVHRDIKPSNIMVTERGGVKVMDFGVARARFDHRESQTQSQQFGTARYMAPERWLEGISGAPSDVFSLGITLLELLSGEPVPRPRLSRSSFHEDLVALGAGVQDDGVRELVTQMCAFDPNARPDARDVVRECRRLEECVGGPSLRTWAEDWVPQHRYVPATGSGSSLSAEGSGETFAWNTDTPPTATAPFAPTTPLPMAPVPDQALSVPAPDEASPPRRRRPAAFWLGGGVFAMVTAWLLWPTNEPVDPMQDPQPADRPVPTTSVPAPPVDPRLQPPSPGPQGVQPDGPPDEMPPIDVEPEPEPAVTPAPVRRVTPEPQPVVATAEPAPPVDVQAPAAVPKTTVTFALRPSSLTASTGGVLLSDQTGILLTQQVHPVVVSGANGEWYCSVLVDDAPGVWRIDDTSRECKRIQ